MQRKKLPRLLRRAFAGAAAVVTAALFFGSAQPISALPAPTSSPGPSMSPTPIPSGTNVLPAGSSLLFVLDDRISSKYARSGDSVRAHLRDTLTLGGMTVASAGTPVRIKIA
ncbi:MAG: hypothetical protein M3M96_09885, partial [Candidatus Eremiobacteraeota bacterium]|nr:hypothetical protein [Candidatus Eremiobacteraeota bacterium]